MVLQPDNTTIVSIGKISALTDALIFNWSLIHCRRGGQVQILAETGGRYYAATYVRLSV